MNDAQQEIFSYFRTHLNNYDVYDGALPPLNTPYPFVYLGNVTQSDSREYKGNNYSGNVRIYIHVFESNLSKRGDLSSCLFFIKQLGMSLSETKSYTYKYQNSSCDILPDNSTKTPLLHGVISIRFNFLAKEKL